MPSPHSSQPTRSPLSAATGRRVARAVIALGAVALVALHLAVLYWPRVTVEGPVSWTDKVVHLLVFALPTVAVGLAVRRVAVVVIVFALHAPISEIVQHVALPGRSGDPWDAVLDVIGVALAAGVLLVRARRERW